MEKHVDSVHESWTAPGFGSSLARVGCGEGRMMNLVWCSPGIKRRRGDDGKAEEAEGLFGGGA
jgi:hypothetical protein